MRVIYDKLKILFVINRNVLIFIKNQVTTDMGAFLVVYHCNRSQCEKRTQFLFSAMYRHTGKILSHWC